MGSIFPSGPGCSKGMHSSTSKVDFDSRMCRNQGSFRFPVLAVTSLN